MLNDKVHQPNSCNNKFMTNLDDVDDDDDGDDNGVYDYTDGDGDGLNGGGMRQMEIKTKVD